MKPENPLRTLVVGAGEAGRALARDLRAAPEYGLTPVGFLDDDPNKSGFDDLPSFVDALERQVVGSDVRTLDLQRLLGRLEAHVATDSVRDHIEGKRVLVTGAGGSIGSELCRQAYGFRPQRLVMLDHDESNLNRLQLELWSEQRLESPDAVVADIRDRARLSQIFDEFRPDVVFHAAAHKHLPLLEHNACEAVKSNVIGTENVVRTAAAHGTQRLINISTDKAADPTSILGATKRVAELIVAGYANVSTFVSVRFGNVLGSRGSLLTVMTEQIRAGVPVTITHRDATRFFMTIEEAAGLVLEAARLATRGAIFVLDMGEAVRIVDIVHAFAEQMHIPDVRIRYTGLRPGEKLTETLFSGHETYGRTVHPRILQAVNGHLDTDFWLRLADLSLAAANNDDRAVRRSLSTILPDYQPPPEYAATAPPTRYAVAY